MLMRLAVRNLFRNLRRTSAVLLTVSLGTGSLLIFHGFNAGLMNQYRENTIHSHYGHGQINTRGYREKVFEKPWEHWLKNWGELRPELEKIQGVEYVFPRVEFFALLTNGRVTVSGRGQGGEGVSESKFFTTLNVVDGVDLSDQADGILLGMGLARALDVHPGDRVTVLGNTIHGSMNAVDLTVTGVFHTGIKEYDDVVFKLPLLQAQTLLDTDRIESVALGLKQLKDWKNIEAAVEQGKLGSGQLEATPFAVLDKVYYQHSVDWLDSQFSIIQIIILTIVVLGIFNTVSTAILERKQEIGNLRANGESVREVVALLGCEGLVLGVAGAFVGVVLACLLNLLVLRNGILMPPAPGITRQFHVWLELQPTMAVMCFVMGTVATLIGTLLAGIRIARMPIGEALRSV